MTRRLFALALASIVVFGVVWKAMSDSAASFEEHALEGPALGLETTSGTTEIMKLSDAPVDVAASETTQREAATHEPGATENDFEPPSDAQWIEGRVVFPAGLPGDESSVVESRGRRFGKGKDSPSRYRAKVEPDGSFRVAFSSKSRYGRLNIEARYMYLLVPWKEKLASIEGGVWIEPLLGGFLRGRVLAPEGMTTSAETFEGATVTVRSEQDTFPNNLIANVAADGSFELLALPPRDDYQITLSSELLSGMVLNEVSIRAGEVTTVELALTRGVYIEGKVVTSEGEPIEHAQVELNLEPDRDGALTLGYGGTASTETNAQGIFVFAGLSHCDPTLSITPPGALEIFDELGPLVDGDRLDKLSYIANPGNSISGTVTWEDGEPAASVMVEARHSPEGGGINLGARKFEVQTDVRGIFELTGLGQPPVMIEASGTRSLESRAGESPSNSTLSAHLDAVMPGTQGLRLTLTAGEVLRGSVRLRGGGDAGPFRVTARPNTFKSSRMTFVKSVKGSFKNEEGDGEFELTGLSPGAWTVSFHAKGAADSDELEIEIPYSGRLDLTVQKSASLRGIVVQPDGVAVSRATVTVLGGPQLVPRNGVPVARSSHEGRFKLASLPPGHMILIAKAEGWAPSVHTAVELAAGEQREDVVLEMRPAGRVDGLVLPSVGEVAERIVRLTGDELFVAGLAKSDAEGRFHFTDLAPGRYTATLDSNEFVDFDWHVERANAVAQSFSLEVGETTSLQLGAGAQDPILVHGRVTSAGSGMPNYIVVISGGEPENDSATRTSNDGSYELVVDGPGAYSLEVHASGAGFELHDQTLQLDIKPGSEQRADFELPTARLTLEIIRPDGEPASRQQIRIRSLENSGPADSPFRGRMSDAEGHFEFRHLKPGRYLLSTGGFSPWNHGEDSFARLLIEVSLAEAAHERVTVQLTESATVSGFASYADGLPAAGLPVLVLDAHGRVVANEWENTNSTGHFNISGLPGGKLTVRVGPAENPGKAHINLPQGGAGTVNVNVPR